MSIKAIDVSVGNFMIVYDKVEMITGIVPTENDTFYFTHSNIFPTNNPMPGDMLFAPEPILLSDEWLMALNFTDLVFPEHIKYVHEAQKLDANFKLIDQLNHTIYRTVNS